LRYAPQNILALYEQILARDVLGDLTDILNWYAERASHLRAHWTIENRVHYPRDVSWQENRYHGRAIAPMLAWLRNLALTLIRQQRFASVPDAWSSLAAHAEEARLWLVGKLKS
jgi:hypothetical protein